MDNDNEKEDIDQVGALTLEAYTPAEIAEAWDTCDYLYTEPHAEYFPPVRPAMLIRALRHNRELLARHAKDMQG